MFEILHMALLRWWYMYMCIYICNSYISIIHKLASITLFIHYTNGQKYMYRIVIGKITIDWTLYLHHVLFLTNQRVKESTSQCHLGIKSVLTTSIWLASESTFKSFSWLTLWHMSTNAAPLACCSHICLSFTAWNISFRFH